MVDAYKDFGTLSIKPLVPPYNPGTPYSNSYPLEYVCGNRHRNGKIGNGQRHPLFIHKKASLEECQRSSVNFLNMPYINDCTYLSQ